MRRTKKKNIKNVKTTSYTIIKVVLFVLSVCLLFTFYKISKNSHTVKSEIAALSESVDELKKENDDLKNDIETMYDDASVMRVAREIFDMHADGEVSFITN